MPDLPTGGVETHPGHSRHHSSERRLYIVAERYKTGFSILCIREVVVPLRAVGKWAAVATAKSLAEAVHLSTAVVIADLR
jgi:hypothetical protein